MRFVGHGIGGRYTQGQKFLPLREGSGGLDRSATLCSSCAPRSNPEAAERGRNAGLDRRGRPARKSQKPSHSPNPVPSHLWIGLYENVFS